MKHWHEFEFSLSLSSDHFWITLADRELFSLSVKLKLSLSYSPPSLWFADHFFSPHTTSRIKLHSFAMKAQCCYIPCLYFSYSCGGKLPSFSGPVYVPDLLILLFSKSPSSKLPQLQSQHCNLFMPHEQKAWRFTPFLGTSLEVTVGSGILEPW